MKYLKRSKMDYEESFKWCWAFLLTFQWRFEIQLLLYLCSRDELAVNLNCLTLRALHVSVVQVPSKRVYWETSQKLWILESTERHRTHLYFYFFDWKLTKERLALMTSTTYLTYLLFLWLEVDWGAACSDDVSNLPNISSQSWFLKF